MANRSPDVRPDDAPESPLGPMSLEAYLRFSEETEWRYEYLDGLAYAMAGATHSHEIVTLNVAARLRTLARGTGCTTSSQGFRVLTPRRNAYLPDAMVACGERPAGDALHLENPCLLVEVLSPSTTRTDLSEKRIAYQEIASLQAYLVVETTSRAVHRHWRDDAGTWQRETITHATGIVQLPCPAGATLTLDEIYEDVEVPKEPPRPRRVFEQPETTTAGAS
ncbi:MAG: Uma2 family endonuclease [Gemmatirosa sp.]